MAKTSGYVSKARAMQLQRIQEDEKIREQEQLARNDLKANLNASWSESLEESSQRRSLKRKNEEIQQEIRLANLALAAVRKAQLKQLLCKEELMYERELHEMGLAFYKDRL